MASTLDLLVSLSLLLDHFQYNLFSVSNSHCVCVCVPFVGCSFMLGRALTSVIWGLVADRYGRKPVILIGTASVLVILHFVSFHSLFVLFLKNQCFDSVTTGSFSILCLG